MKNRKAVVVIPVHSSNPSPEEVLALKQCINVLSNYDIFLVYPKGVEIEIYKDLSPYLRFLSINPKWQSSIENYNRLKCSAYFYKLFLNYDYLLTYELDAFVFRDELNYWCDKGYSYIGAPWFEGYTNPLEPNKFVGVGNSGFSLRSISNCLKCIRRVKQITFLYRVFNKLGLMRFCTFIEFLDSLSLNKILNIEDKTHIPQLIKNYFVNEDLFWSLWVGKTFSDFKIAPIEEAYKFSFEVNPKRLFQMNENKLPFGCHAWAKYDSSFWKDHIC